MNANHALDAEFVGEAWDVKRSSDWRDLRGTARLPGYLLIGDMAGAGGDEVVVLPPGGGGEDGAMRKIHGLINNARESWVSEISERAVRADELKWRPTKLVLYDSHTKPF